MIGIRRLGPEDAAAYFEIRHRALREHPEAFLSSPEEEPVQTAEQARERLAGPQSAPDNGIFGAFLENKLVGTVGFVRETRRKIRHKAVIWGVYVAPEARGKGLGRMMLDAAISALKAVPGIEQAHLSVSVANPHARRLYAAAGFVGWGMEPRAMAIDDRRLDEEHMVLML